jgi:hypothetical protein
MRWRIVVIVWSVALTIAALIAYLVDFEWPPKKGAIVDGRTAAETWWSAHVANPLLSAFLFGALLGTVFLPGLWRQVRPFVLPVKLRPDLNGSYA